MSRILVKLRVPARRPALLAVLELIVALNRLWLRERRTARRGVPISIYQAGVRYKREARDPATGMRREDWRTYPEILEHGSGDCEDLATARVAELRERGINAKPWLMKNGRMWHVQVMLPDGTVEDPSAAMGMRGSA